MKLILAFRFSGRLMWAVMTADDGKSYCRRHDPAVVQAKRDEQTRQWDDERTLRLARERQDLALLAFLREHGFTTVEDLRAALEGMNDH